MSEKFDIIKESDSVSTEEPTISKEEEKSKSLKIDKSIEYLFKIAQIKIQDKPKSQSKITREMLKIEKKKLEITKKELLKPCKGKTKDNKDCSRKEIENCNGFCKQHYNIEKEKNDTTILIEKHKKNDILIL
jgi:hypothetical protein